MWWSDRRALLVGLVMSGLAACGFTPLYAPGTSAARMQGRIEVAVLPGEPGFLLRERLTERLGEAAAPEYRLDIELELSRTGVALTTQNVTTRFNVVGTAAYRLVPLAGGPAVAGGVVRSITGFSAPESETASAFASLAAEQDAERRLAVDLADRIVQRLALSSEEWE